MARGKGFGSGTKKARAYALADVLGAQGDLLAGANRTGQSTVVATILVVPKWKAEFHATTKFFDFLNGAGRGICCGKLIRSLWFEVFVVSVLQDRFEDVHRNLGHGL